MFNLLRFLWFVKRRFYNWDQIQIKKYQQKQAKKMVKKVVKKSKFYADFYKGYNLADFYSLPFMNKQLFMENFTILNTKGLTKEECIQHCLEKEVSRDFNQYFKGYLVGMSTGTSGNKGIEFATKIEALMMQLMVFFRFPFPKTRKIHLAFILRVFSPGFGYNGVKIKISYVSPLDTLDKIVERLHSLQPNLISGPPSVLKSLAREKRKGKLKLTPILIVSYGEVLSKDVKEIIEDSFDCEVIEVYKSSESFIALPCKEGNLHINEDTTLVEVLDEEMKSVSPGESGFVVVTDFIKYGTPIIRYKLNDLITIDPKPCACSSKFRVIKQIHGRADDVIVGERTNKQEMQIILPDFIRRSIVSSSEYIEEYRAIQQSPIKIVIKLQLKSEIKQDKHLKDLKANLEEEITGKISKIFIQHNCKAPSCEFYYTKISHDFDKKLRRIQREFKEHF